MRRELVRSEGRTLAFSGAVLRRIVLGTCPRQRSKPVIVLRPYEGRAPGRPRKVNYLERLKRYMPRALSAARRRELDEADRAER